MKIKSFLEQIRKPQNNISLIKQIAETAGIILFGFALGILQKWMDGTASNAFPLIIQQLDISNYFGRLAIWILLATIISVYAKSPLRAAINTFFEVFTWIIGVILLRRKPKEYAIEIGLSVVIAFVYQLVMPHWG